MTIKPITCRMDCLEAMRRARQMVAAANDEDQSGLSKMQSARAYLIDALACADAFIEIHKETK